ncbi:hypothetical protein HWV23_03375 [Natronomonas halophila]|uniref:hypothetical protein n=1 Tax=Natronomonas halophila TaxID=2747817 RepID=UPI0015B694A8|nr:hypothetical protein [Natronomonas halophila]QLD84792.1 hypothetical protein HWV23_03375 [Natronomonas halophila]
MPAGQTVDHYDCLKFDVEPDVHPDPVYFTEQSPAFQVHITNDNSKYEWWEHSDFGWNMVVDGDVVRSEREIFGPLDNGESTKTTIEPGVLAYEGHGVIEIYTGKAGQRRDTTRRNLHSNDERNCDPAYSFSVWDESHYEATVRRPKQLQKGIIFTSAVLIIFAFIQLVLASSSL